MLYRSHMLTQLGSLNVSHSINTNSSFRVVGSCVVSQRQSGHLSDVSGFALLPGVVHAHERSPSHGLGWVVLPEPKWVISTERHRPSSQTITYATRTVAATGRKEDGMVLKFISVLESPATRRAEREGEAPAEPGLSRTRPARQEPRPPKLYTTDLGACDQYPSLGKMNDQVLSLSEDDMMQRIAGLKVLSLAVMLTAMGSIKAAYAVDTDTSPTRQRGAVNRRIVPRWRVGLVSQYFWNGP